MKLRETNRNPIHHRRLVLWSFSNEWFKGDWSDELDYAMLETERC